MIEQRTEIMKVLEIAGGARPSDFHVRRLALVISNTIYNSLPQARLARHDNSESLNSLLQSQMPSHDDSPENFRPWIIF